MRYKAENCEAFFLCALEYHKNIDFSGPIPLIGIRETTDILTYLDRYHEWLPLFLKWLCERDN